MSDDLDYLDKLPEIADVGIAQTTTEAIEKAADELDNIEEQLYTIDKKTRQLKERKDYITKTYIPRVLGGANTLETESGLKVIVRRFMYITVKNKDRLMAYLDRRGDGDMIDTTIKVKRLPEAVRERIRDMIVDAGGFISKSDRSLHHSTQRSYFDKLLKNNPEQQAIIEKFGEVKEYFETKVSRSAK